MHGGADRPILSIASALYRKGARLDRVSWGLYGLPGLEMPPTKKTLNLVEQRNIDGE